MKKMMNASANLSKQMTMAYIAYMMGGSLFHRCRCASSQMEMRLLLHYREMKEEKVLAAEERVLRELDKKGKRFLEGLADLDCIVHIRQEDGLFVLVFETGGFDGLLAEVSERGRFASPRCMSVGEPRKRLPAPTSQPRGIAGVREVLSGEPEGAGL